jgi:hypothetical protein
MCKVGLPRAWFKPPAVHPFATDRSKAVTPLGLFFVNCFGVLFETGHFINPCFLFLSIFWLRRKAVFSGCGDSCYAKFTFFCKTCHVDVQYCI